MEKRLKLTRQHLKEWQDHFKQEIQNRQVIAQHHRQEMEQLRSQPFQFDEQSMLVHQQIQELSRWRNSYTQRHQAIQDRQDQERAVLEQLRS